jgi:tRNA threonylcarbamoyladenosine biosynthesis protein TsaE
MAASERELTGLRVFLSRSPEATEALGAALALAIEADALLRAEGVAVALDGELGAGKTALTRGVARGLGAQDCVHSPSFTLMHTYEGRLPIYHFDAWMEGRESAFLDGGGAEWLESGGVALIEWAQRVEAWLPRPRLELLLEHVGAAEPEARRLSLSCVPSRPGGVPDPRERALRSLVADLWAGAGELPEGLIEES